ncbi:Protein of unknown function [Gryllus bimaculatus]|nr:Protein of unknown function [Gryllus bimaculatus]
MSRPQHSLSEWKSPNENPKPHRDSNLGPSVQEAGTSPLSHQASPWLRVKDCSVQDKNLKRKRLRYSLSELLCVITC